MRRIHRLMTLHFGAGAGTRVIARELGISHSTVREYLGRIRAAGITWPLPAEITDEDFERQLFANGGVQTGARYRVEPDWAAVARELKRPGVNLMILWEEYRAFTRTATPTAATASCSASSSAGYRPACDRTMSLATRPSLTSRARRFRSSIRRPA